MLLGLFDGSCRQISKAEVSRAAVSDAAVLCDRRGKAKPADSQKGHSLLVGGSLSDWSLASLCV